MVIPKRLFQGLCWYIQKMDLLVHADVGVVIDTVGGIENVRFNTSEQFERHKM